MILLIDVGNTNIVMGVYEGKKMVHGWRLGTKVGRTSDEYGLQVDSILRHYNISIKNIDDIVIGSVVPSLQHTLVSMCRKYFDMEPMIIGKGTKTGMPIKYDNPREVGADRIVNSVAVFEKYGGPSILVDIGTAITFDVISEKGEYLGGAIAPGVGISSEALFSRTSKLPKVELKLPEHVIGKTTVESIQSGIVYGFIGLVDNIIENILEELNLTKDQVNILGTGGYAKLITERSKYIEDYDSNITLEGMRLVYEKSKRDRNEN